MIRRLFVIVVLILVTLPSPAVSSILHMCGQSQATHLSKGCCCCDVDDDGPEFKDVSCCTEREIASDAALLTVRDALFVPMTQEVVFHPYNDISREFRLFNQEMRSVDRAPPDSALVNRILMSSFLL